MTFAEDFKEWEDRMLTLENETPAGIEEIRQCIRADWKIPELRASWTAHVAAEAKHSRELKVIAAGVTARVNEYLTCYSCENSEGKDVGLWCNKRKAPAKLGGAACEWFVKEPGTDEGERNG